MADAVIRGTRGGTLRAKFTLFEQLKSGPRRSLVGATIQAVSGTGTPLPAITILNPGMGELQLEWDAVQTQAMKPGRVNRYRGLRPCLGLGFTIRVTFHHSNGVGSRDGEED